MARYMYDDWDDLPYFISSQQQVFEAKLIRRLNIDVLVLCAAYRCGLAYIHFCYLNCAHPWIPDCVVAGIVCVRNMAAAYEMEFPEAALDRRSLRAMWLRHNILSWMHEKNDLEGWY